MAGRYRRLGVSRIIGTVNAGNMVSYNICVLYESFDIIFEKYKHFLDILLENIVARVSSTFIKNQNIVLY